MELQNLFNIPQAIEAYQKIVKERKKYTRQSPQRNTVFCITEINNFESALPESNLRNKVVQVLGDGKWVLIGPVRLQLCGSIVEFHVHSADCSCSELFHVTDKYFILRVHEVLKMLASYGFLLQVKIDDKGFSTISSVA